MRGLWSLALTLALVPACENGPYSAPPGQFFCGTETCSVTDQICVHAPGVDGGPESIACGVPPEACTGMPTCACAASACKGSCQTAGDGSVVVTCSP